MAVIKFDDEHTVTDAHTVAVYSVTREYGGAEEGGWWYDRGDLVALGTADSASAALALADDLERGEYRSTGRELSSVNFGMSGNDRAYRMNVYAPGDKIRHHFPEHTPQYR